MFKTHLVVYYFVTVSFKYSVHLTWIVLSVISCTNCSSFMFCVEYSIIVADE